jgi:hypothetical protein
LGAVERLASQHGSSQYDHGAGPLRDSVRRQRRATGSLSTAGSRDDAGRRRPTAAHEAAELHHGVDDGQ